MHNKAVDLLLEAHVRNYDIVYHLLRVISHKPLKL